MNDACGVVLGGGVVVFIIVASLLMGVGLAAVLDRLRG